MVLIAFLLLLLLLPLRQVATQNQYFIKVKLVRGYIFYENLRRNMSCKI